MADKEITIKVSTETETDQLDDLKSVLESIENTNIEVELEADSTPIDEAKESIDETTDSATELSSEMENAGTSTNNLASSMSGVDSSNIQQASSDADNLTSSADTATQSIDDLSNSMGLVEGVMLMDAANQIGALGDQAEGMAQDMNTASISVGQLATQTGIAEPQMVSLINHISNATFPNDEAMMYVKSLDQIGVSADNLGQSATDLDKINDAFGLGASTVNSLGQELSVLGVDMNNISSSFNALAYANANTVGGMENFYTFLRRYDSQFKELGFDIDQASVIIAAATHKFGGGRQAVSGLNEALKESNGDTRALEQALGLQAGALENASSLTGEYEGQLQSLADEEAEHKTWLDQLGAAWEDLSLSLAPVLSPLGSFIGLIGQVGQTSLAINSILQLAETFGLLDTSTIAAKFSGLKSRIIDVASSMKTTMANAVNSIKTSLLGLKTSITSVASTIKTTLVNALKSMATYIQSTVIPAVKNAILAMKELALNVLKAGYNALKTVVMWVAQKLALIASTIAEYGLAAAQAILNAVMSANPIMIVVLAIAALVAALIWAYNNVDWFREMVDNLWQNIQGFAGWISGVFMGAIQGLGDAFNNAGQTIQSSIQGAIDFVMGVLQGLWTYITTLGGLIPENVSITGNSIVDTVLKVMAFLLTLPMQIGMIFINIIAQTLGFGENFSQKMFQSAFQGGANFINTLTSLPSRLWGILSQAINNAINFASQIGSTLRNAANNAVTNFTNGIRNLGNGFADELRGIIDRATNFVGEIGGILWEAGANAVQNFLNGLQRHSPGKMQREFRAELVEMTDFVPSQSDKLSRNINRMSSNMVSSFDGFDFNKGEVVFSNGDVGNNNLSSITDILNELIPILISATPTINVYGDVDSDDRMNQIVEVVRKELNWNNRTAGRDV